MNPHRSTAVCLLLATMTAAAQGQRNPVPPAAPPGLTAAPLTLNGAWQTALSTMREHKAPGLVFVLPPADALADPAAAAAAVERFQAMVIGKMARVQLEVKTARDLMLLHLQSLRNDQPPRPAADETARPVDLAVAFALAVPIVAEAQTCGARPGETLLLLRADGKRDRGFALDLGDRDAVERALAQLWSGDALAMRRANVPPDLRDADQELFALRQAATDDAGKRRYQERVQELQSKLYAVAPAMVRSANGAVIMDAQLRGWLGFTTPLGTAVGQTWDPCPPCGMAAMPLPVRSVLKLLAQ